jgi:hypothetical protein
MRWNDTGGGFGGQAEQMNGQAAALAQQWGGVKCMLCCTTALARAGWHRSRTAMTAILDYTLQVFSGERLVGEARALQSKRARQQQLADLYARHPDADRAVLRINGIDQEAYALRDGKVMATQR